MKERMRQILDPFHKYNSDNMAFQTFGFDKDIFYDALIVAPSFSPYKLGLEKNMM